MSPGWSREALWRTAWCAVALSFPWSNAFMSVATALLALVALGELAQPHRRVPETRFSRLSGLALLALVALSAASTFWSLDGALALHDVRVKLPLAVGGLVLLAARGSALLSARSMDRVLRCAAFSAVAATATIVVLDLVEGAPFGGRSASRFISHIRFGLWWAVLLPLIASRLSRTWSLLAVASAFLAWFWTESLTGLLTGLLTIAWWGPMLIRPGNASQEWPSPRAVRARLAVLTGAIAALAIGLHSALPSDYPDLDALPEFTENGEEYQHHPERRVTENGHFVWTEVAWGELSAAWRSRHDLPFDAVKGRLIRFLASKGLPKDQVGVETLSGEEVEAIAAGAASVVEWRELGWARRWNRMCFNWGQWLDGVRSGNASLLARQVYQSTALSAIGTLSWSAHVIGVGTGSGRAVLTEAYAREQPEWPADMRHRSHNQWLSLWLEQGWIGLLLLIAAGWAVLHRPWGLPGLIVLWLSFCFEDTLETQAGVTLALWVLALPVLLSSAPRRAAG